MRPWHNSPEEDVLIVLVVIIIIVSTVALQCHYEKHEYEANAAPDAPYLRTEILQMSLVPPHVIKVHNLVVEIVQNTR